MSKTITAGSLLENPKDDTRPSVMPWPVLLANPSYSACAVGDMIAYGNGDQQSETRGELQGTLDRLMEVRQQATVLVLHSIAPTPATIAVSKIS